MAPNLPESSQKIIRDMIVVSSIMLILLKLCVVVLAQSGIFDETFISLGAPKPLQTVVDGRSIISPIIDALREYF
jgi:hypothetical protein